MVKASLGAFAVPQAIRCSGLARCLRPEFAMTVAALRRGRRRVERRLAGLFARLGRSNHTLVVETTKVCVEPVAMERSAMNVKRSASGRFTIGLSGCASAGDKAVCHFVSKKKKDRNKEVH